MKNKVIWGMILIILSFISALLLCRVEAYSGEIDPENYIKLPSSISVKNKVGTGTISLSSSAKGYSISYQKIDITKSTLDSISNKLNETNKYIEESNKTVKEKEANLTTLLNKYNELAKSETATDKEKTNAKAKYDEAYAEYETYINNTKTEVTKKQSEYLALIPNYTDSWKKTTNTSNNVELDFANYTGTAHFILWVKIDNGTNTYYNFTAYSSEIKEDNNDNNNNNNDKSGDNTNNGEWTDFSKVKFELKKDGQSRAIIEVSGVTPKEGSTYSLLITSNNNKPNVTNDLSNEGITLLYDKNTKTFKAADETSKVAKYVELNQDIYVSVIERRNSINNVVTYGNKLERYAEAKYSDAFSATYMSYNRDQIVMSFTHSGENHRRFQIKIGKITDQEILKKIKNQNSSGFADLMTYAKSDSGNIYDQTVSSNDENYAIKYTAGETSGTGNSVIDLKGIEKDAYYYLYVKTDDENGKYISNEAVTLARASVYENEKWFMFFYGADDFTWADFGNVEGGNTESPKELPRAGANGILVIISSMVAVGGFIAYRKYKKNNF